MVLTGKDVVFEVLIDGAKRGQLHLSEGGIDWYPPHAQAPIACSWAQLAAFMEE
jgi:hypothetical protein